mmetsp:Transcript_13352/g.12949  ORF Transcript_13352/g.12949 Transcript_13352/m.12949 type:complete len:109 (-) Transcript_13352:285-611(-)|eukprot:CAMPEP_0197826676 /NCGR_PEP_ID=MMETSP1437-20131217/3598_1 /TAXON_ID=49252 ORGANISM="Eucampia antarctica, Strain CCMP1452" /NCGR_SAMPLE_ID=MMETSP1437 /ASSEMBLY_ACC=CAM_ASM_001096 /LENGTH=108 /DNA_ID=CAMNT_0043427205 /DNA_START=67 /DNA_END=393 /DNA_ORIENTATION=-
MTSMYDEPKSSEVKLTPYPHSERGQQYGRAQDPVAYLLSTEQRARERQVAYETVKLLRKKVIQCYREAGVNHYDDCKEHTERYYKVVVQNDVGQVHPKWENEAKHDGW